MKRERSLTDIFAQLSVGAKKRKYLHILKYPKQNDRFNIGHVQLTKSSYSLEEVVDILNEREKSLYEKFQIFLKSFRTIDVFGEAFIPNWIK